MAIIMVNKDGTSNAKPGDYVVTGGGVYKKTESGSIRVMGLDTPTGSSSKMSDVVSTFNRLTSGSGSGSGSSSGGSGSTSTTKSTSTGSTPATTDGTTDIYDSAENYDNYTLPLSYDYSNPSYDTSGTLSKVVGYAVVGLVLLVVADRLMNGGGNK